MSWDAVICDYNLKGFTAFEALAALQQSGHDIPFLVLSGTVPEDVGVSIMKAGAHDVIVKERMARLIPAIQREVKDAELRRQNKELQKQLFHAQRMEGIGAITSGVAHDLNNILAPILMASDILAERSFDPDTARLFEIIETNARHGAEVVGQLLSLSRKIDGKRTIVDLKHLLRDLALLAKQTCPQSITIKLDMAQKLWSVPGDATQLYQVVLNLIVNSRDAMPSGGVLSISAQNVHVDESFAAMSAGARPGPYALISISDTGVGIAQDVLPKIFDPFFTTKADGGTGLGLATVLGIVKNHNGFVHVKSTIGTGTSFNVYLPATEDEILPRERAIPEPNAFGNGELVVVAEDQPDVRELTGKVLTTHRYTVLLARDGPEALVQLSRHLAEVRLLITDINLPFMDGVALIRAVQRMSPAVKIIASSGSENREKELTELCVSTVLLKPYTADTLVKTVHRVLNTSQRSEIRTDEE